MSSSLLDLKEQALRWAEHDPDPETRAEALAMVEEGDGERLQAAFGHRLEFGTAGLRGRLGPGPGQMNRVLVQRVASGLGAYVGGLGAPKTAGSLRKTPRVFLGRRVFRSTSTTTWCPRPSCPTLWWL